MAATRPTPRKARPSGHGSAQTADAAAQPLNRELSLELARSVVGSTLGGAQHLLHYLDQVQHLNSQTLKEMATILDGAADELRSAGDVQDLLTLQANLASTQMARTAQAWGSLLASWLDAGTQFAELAQQEAARLSRQMAGNGAAPQGAAMPAPDEVDALGLLGSAQDAMTQLTNQWVEMVKDVSARAQLAQI